jgi:hypothetical protein
MDCTLQNLECIAFGRHHLPCFPYRVINQYLVMKLKPELFIFLSQLIRCRFHNEAVMMRYLLRMYRFQDLELESEKVVNFYRWRQLNCFSMQYCYFVVNKARHSSHQLLFLHFTHERDSEGLFYSVASLSFQAHRCTRGISQYYSDLFHLDLSTKHSPQPHQEHYSKLELRNSHSSFQPNI